MDEGQKGREVSPSCTVGCQRGQLVSLDGNPGWKPWMENRRRRGSSGLESEGKYLGHFPKLQHHRTLGGFPFCRARTSIYKGKSFAKVPLLAEQPGTDKPICFPLDKSFINVAMTFKVSNGFMT